MRIKNIFLLFFCLVAFVQCNDTDDYYDVPGWLEAPLYELLQKQEHFSTYLQCIERTNYASVIKEGGIYTLMAPNDEAFKAYFQENGYSSVDDIPQEEVNKIVGYSMILSDWKLSNMGDLFGKQSDGSMYLKGRAIKRKTNYYPTIYRDPEYNNEWVFDQTIPGGLLLYNDNYYMNYKYMYVFMSSYFNNRGLTASDYESFFDVSYIGRNIINGEIVPLKNPSDPDPASDPDGLVARNGVIHEVTKVNLPLDNMDKYLFDNQYKVFKENFLDFKTVSGTYAFKYYWEYATFTELYKKIHPELNIDKVYVKIYDPNYFFFSPALDIYDGDLDKTQQYGYTLFVPTNEALQEYINTKLLKYYDNIEDVPLEAIYTLVNTHMVDDMVWPSEFKTQKVSTGEFLNGEGPSGPGFDDIVVDKKLASNGFIYTINYVIKSKLFETLYSEVFLNPKYTMLNSAFVKYYNSSLRAELMKSSISESSTGRYTLLALSNKLLQTDGYQYDDLNNAFSNPLIVGSGSTSDGRIQRLMRMHVFQGYQAGDINTEVDFTHQGPSQYNGWGFRVTYYGDMVRYKIEDSKIKLQAAGNVTDNTYVTIKKIEDFDNGSVYAIDEEEDHAILQYSPRKNSGSVDAGWADGTLWSYIQKAGTDNSSRVSTFVEYVRVALKDSESDALSGISEEAYYTILMVNNTSMTTAQSQGLIPSLSELTTNPTGENMEKAANFLRGHFLQGRVYADDGLDYLFPYNVYQPNSDLASTMYRANNEQLGLINARTYVNVSKNGDRLVFAPMIQPEQEGLIDISNSRNMTVSRGAVVTAQPDNFRSNRMAGRAVLHEVNGYFSYELIIP